MSTNDVVNGVSTRPKPLEIIIAGAGIGGLCAAIGLRQQGHNVTIYEQSRMSQETGAAIHIAPNCNGLLKRLGLDTRKHGSVELLGLTEYLPSGVFKFSMDTRPMNKMWQHSWELIHRAHLHSALKDIALSSDGKGKPVELHLSSAVSSVDPLNATLTLADGTTHHADLILGADGVHSKTRQAIPGGNLTPFDGGKTAYRFLIPTADIAADLLAAPILQHDGHLIMWVAEDRRVVMYPCVGGTQMNFVAMFPSEESSPATEDAAWQQAGNKEKMLNLFSSFGESVIALLKLVDGASLKTWTLLDMDKMPSFVYGQFAVIGDAAHPFLPHQAQGGAQAIEDAMSLAALLPLGTNPEDVHERLAVYQEQRYERSHHIQHCTRLSGADLQKGQHLDMKSFTAYNVGHDEWHSSTGALNKHLATKYPETRKRVPIGFGPAPGPRQPLGLATYDPEIQHIRATRRPETSSTYSIRFRSSRTYLQNLLPPGFSFVGPATVCEASISCTTLDGMTWLGGGGYSFIMLCLHGIQYTQRDGERKFGRYIALVLENLADPIVTGRDDLGMPKLFSDIQVRTEEDGQVDVEVSWRGSTFVTMSFRGLSDPPVENGSHPETESLVLSPSKERGQFSWRYVPAVGQSGKADVEYPVFLPFANAVHDRETKVRQAKDASVVFSEGSWQSLPTLHHIARVLAEIPNYGLVEAKHVTETGVDDLSSAYRIE